MSPSAEHTPIRCVNCPGGPIHEYQPRTELMIAAAVQKFQFVDRELVDSADLHVLYAKVEAAISLAPSAKRRISGACRSVR